MSIESANEVVRSLRDECVNFFVGVPDSVLSDLSHALAKLESCNHVVAPNEGAAVGLGIGHYLASRTVPVIYLQNSGLGNALNPLVSLSHRDVYGIPMLLLIGYRGQNPDQDEPQHRVQGLVTVPWLTSAGFSVYETGTAAHLIETIGIALREARERLAPVCVLVGPGLLDSEKNKQNESSHLPSRENVIKSTLSCFGDEAIYVSTTGKTSRELASMSESEQADNAFLCIGGMGHAVSIALGLAMENQSRTVICLDGDGSFQMHMGASALAGALSPKNLTHLVINNGVHDSVGGQDVASKDLQYGALTQSFGYATSHRVDSIEQLERHLKTLQGLPGPHFIEVLSASGSRPDLGRPIKSPYQRMKSFLEADVGHHH